MWASPVSVEASCGSKIHSLDWKESTDQRGGWLALSGTEGTVGVSWIGDRDEEREEEKGADATRAGVHMDNVACTEEACLFKSHFNLRDHSGEVKLVRWMPSGERLASYDSWGKITVWRNRANIMAYDFGITTSTLVTDMQWSPCGYNIIICGKEGTIQMFSSTSGLIFFSIQVCALGSLSFTAQFSVCSWNKLGHQVALGTQNGEFVILDPISNSRSLSTLTLRKGIAVRSIEWFGPAITYQSRDGTGYQSQRMTAYLANGEVIFFNDSSPPVCMSVRTGITDGAAKWSSKALILAVVGSGRTTSEPAVRFINTKGEITFSVKYDQALQSPSLPITNIAWALEDSTLLFTKGSNLLKMQVKYCIPSLQHLCREAIVFSMEKRKQSASSTQHIMKELPLPVNEIDQLVSMTAQLIPVPLDVYGPGSLKALFESLRSNQRLHCKMDTTHQESNCTGYVVKFEYLNQYIPILEATRKPKSAGTLFSSGYLIRPAFEYRPLASDSLSKNRLLEPQPIDPHTCSQSKASQSSPSRTSTILKQLCSALRPGRGQTVMDISEKVHPPLSPSGLHSSRPILAEVNGKTITNRYQFFGTLPQLQSGSLGTLNISTSYIACKPRQIHLTLQPPDIAEPLCLESKMPGWNERYQTYELDFGGRVNRDSVKNFQIERNGQIVLQFGRIDATSFCLDLQAPFSPVQALCVALSYLT